ncbi:MAG: SDR family NAD(P)-dependent oxidoreductase [Phenylobacterium sp.]|uniref:SDR family NAD(P)-dependent oxidoreductase n=1 Tax=Phenylobacterium sp. TaxID=1871053 RepID=UPI0027354179|nr:SDR family NAD(P)-dependent oxidoreductase [Phenylobacterium sp.]MDP3750015.1 SDR family NAD(P)-dependent oxidoreductase [Phenylobacterium sp.]
MRFDNKVAVITGGASGIGKATALGYAQRGGSVAILDFDTAAAEATAAEVRNLGGRAAAIHVNVGDRLQLEGAIAAAQAELGRIDFLHNNAYAHPKGFERVPVGEIPPEHWDHAIAVGLSAVFWGTRAVLPIMSGQGGGTIVNTSSIGGVLAAPTGAAYGTIKAGLIHFTRIVALEYAKQNIRCNAIAPGLVDTPLVANADPARKADMLRAVPLGRAAKTEEIANAILFLASDLASFVTGECLMVDGGQTVQLRTPAA